LKSAPTSDITLVHDGARPFVSRELIEKIICDTKKHGSCVPKLEITESLKKDGKSVNREKFFTTQTPQGFKTENLMYAYSQNPNGTDDAEVFERFFPVHYIDGERTNKKITFPEDLPYKIGIGFDTHLFVGGRPLILGGVEIPHTHGLFGHSDADALAHSIIDALLSAAALPDIGTQFPDIDPRYKDISSMELLECTVDSIQCTIINISSIIICDQPKMAEHIPKIRENLSKTLKIDPQSIGITAKTTEGQNPNSLTCHTTCLVRL
jgi:2-C-methyl-D-erythritol 2,4-cyclodiphosphate synthase